MTRLVGVCVVVGIIFGLWQALVVLADLPAFILPSPMRVWSGVVGKCRADSRACDGYIERDIDRPWPWAILGAATAIGLAMSSLARLVVRPMMVLSQALPVFALAPILTLWLGYGLGPKVIMALLIIYFPVTSAFFDGLMQTPRGMLDLGRVMQGRRWQIMRHIRIPAAIPGLASGLRLAAVYAQLARLSVNGLAPHRAWVFDAAGKWAG